MKITTVPSAPATPAASHSGPARELGPSLASGARQFNEVLADEAPKTVSHGEGKKAPPPASTPEKGRHAAQSDVGSRDELSLAVPALTAEVTPTHSALGEGRDGRAPLVASGAATRDAPPQTESASAGPSAARGPSGPSSGDTADGPDARALGRTRDPLAPPSIPSMPTASTPTSPTPDMREIARRIDGSISAVVPDARPSSDRGPLAGGEVTPASGPAPAGVREAVSRSTLAALAALHESTPAQLIAGRVGGAAASTTPLNQPLSHATAPLNEVRAPRGRADRPAPIDVSSLKVTAPASRGQSSDTAPASSAPVVVNSLSVGHLDASPRATYSLARAVDVGSLAQAISRPLQEGDGGYSVTLAMRPGSLGQVQAVVSLHGNDLHVAIAPETTAGHDAIASTMTSLRDELSRGGVNVSVTLHDPGHSADSDRRERPFAASVRAPVPPSGVGSTSVLDAGQIHLVL